MKIDINLDVLRGHKLFIGAPMYGGQCHGMFARSCSDLAALCTHYGIQLSYYYLFNESLITRARNYCADEFMRSDASHLMFIDSDIGFDPRDVIALMAMQNEEHNPGNPYDVIAGPYPKKCISWEKIKVAVDKGFADEDPNDLEKYVGDYVFNPLSNQSQMRIDEPVQVLEAGTGFMMIRRSTFEKYAAAFPERSYNPDHIRTEQFDGTREIMAYFDCVIDDKREYIIPEMHAFFKNNPKATPEDILNFVEDKRSSEIGRDYSNRYLSEDYMFCYNTQKMGGQVWFCPWMKLQHVGTYVFGGSLPDLAKIGAAPTADASTIKKKRPSKDPVNPNVTLETKDLEPAPPLQVPGQSDAAAAAVAPPRKKSPKRKKKKA